MGNSPLVNYTKYSPHYSSRNGKKISKITIHHMAGNLSVETCGNVFQTRQASSTYGVDSNGRVGLYVDESKRPWTSSNRANDEVAVTIEVANDEIGGSWHVSDKALAKTIELCVDVCKRNGIKQLVYTGTPDGNLTRHNMFIATGCPGPYLQSMFPYIAKEVNKKLNGGGTTPTKLTVDGIFGYQSTMRLQAWLGTYQDGIISGQTAVVKPYIKSLISATFEGGGSACIKALQKKLASYGAGTADGLCGKKTVMALQKFLKANNFNPGTIDGYFGPNSAKALQRYLNTQK